MAVPDRAPAEAVGIPVLAPVPPVAMVLAAATSIQFGAALAATLFDEIGPAGASVLRLAPAAVLLLAIWRPRVSAHPRRHLRLAALFGLTLGAMNLCFYEGLARVPLGPAVTIEFAGPVAVAVLLSRRRLDLVWVALAVAGIVLLANPFGAHGLNVVGVVFLLGAAACWGLYIVVGGRLTRAFSGGTGLALGAVVATLVPLAPGIAQAGAKLVHPRLLGLGIAVALLSSVIPYTLETESLRRVPAHVFGVLMSLEPAVAAVAGFLVLGQTLGARDLLAIGLVTAASVGVTRTMTTAPRLEQA
ncbi:MAG TPA: EamA family transporter [Solirubrobacteraceae bacterium]|nr:EamA family transporter [Solirubrobacteraceae bacterium]